jgi:hypothetical protein
MGAGQTQSIAFWLSVHGALKSMQTIIRLQKIIAIIGVRNHFGSQFNNNRHVNTRLRLLKWTI